MSKAAEAIAKEIYEQSHNDTGLIEIHPGVLAILIDSHPDVKALLETADLVDLCRKESKCAGCAPHHEALERWLSREG